MSARTGTLAGSPHALPPMPPDPSKHRAVTTILQRTGTRPLRFDGTLLAFADRGAAPGWSRIWLALYSDSDRGYVIEIRCEPRAKNGARAWCHATRTGTLEAAIAAFERTLAVCGDDAAVPAGADAGLLLLHAAGQLCRDRLRASALRHEIGMFLYRLCTDLSDC